MPEQKRKILLIEDEKIIADLIIPKLSRAGFEVVEAIDGEEAMERLKEDGISLVLLDLLLPGLDGFGFLNRIKKDPALHTIPVIILSNLGQNEDVKKGLELGAAAYLIKAHFTPDQILKKVEDTIGRHTGD